MVVFSGSLFSQLSHNQTNKDKRKYIKAQNLLANYNYAEALDIFKQLADEYPEDYDIYTQIGYCYLNLGDAFSAVDNLTKSVDYYRSEDKIGSADGSNALYLLSEAYFMSYDFSSAKKHFQELLPYSNKKQNAAINKKITQCDSAETMFFNAHGFTVIQPDIINSSAPDYCPVVTMDNSKLFFTSRRIQGSTGGNKDIDGYGFEDIYSVDINGGNFSAPVNLGTPVNTSGHEATSSISADGTELFIYKSSQKDPGNIFYSTLNGNSWSEPIDLGKPINTKFKETHASLSPDGQLLYFTSNRRGGKGGLDIYVAEKDADGNWTNVKNLSNLNTEGDEEGPFVSPDGNTLYFSTNGRIGMGGFDIFKSIKQSDNSWGTPQNMGFPLNTVNDDIYFVPTTDPGTAYYSSKQFDETSDICLVQMYDNNEDMIFVKGFTFDANTDTLAISQTKTDSVKAGNRWFSDKKTVKFGKNDTIFISNINGNYLLDSVCKIPSNTQIYVHDVNQTNKVGPYKPYKPSGKYGIIINPVDQKLIQFTAPNYIYDLLRVESVAGVVYYTAQLDTIIEGKVKSVKNTKFDVENENLSEIQEKEFKILADFMNNNPNLFVDISAYGYSDVPESYDQQRNDAIIQYLVDNGVNQDRIYSGLSPNNISGDFVEYTIYDKTTLQEAIDEKDRNQITTNVTVTQGVLVSDVTFDINKSSNPDYFDELDIVAQYLVDNQDAKIGVYGYTDTQGNPDYNKQLSKKRATFVTNYLISKGANANQITTEGKGYSKQVSINKDQNGNYVWNSLGYNRRVEIVVLDQGSNSKLFVKPVDVPAQYSVSDNTGMNYLYSVMVIVSESQLPNSAFNFSVAELLGTDGLYSYIHGEFQSEAEAQAFADSIIAKYPKAYVFINNFRK